jgi:hypothetical protein
VLAYFLSCSKGTGRVSRTVTLALSVGFMIYTPKGVSDLGVAGILQGNDEETAFTKELAGPV